MKNVTVKEIYLKAIGGSDIFDCINESISICAKKGVDCILSHNGIEVKISVEKLRDTIYKEWDTKLKKKCDKLDNDV